MANIKVNTGILYHAVDEEQTIAGRLSDIEAEINQVITKLNTVSTASFESIKKSLRVSGKSVVSEREKLLILARTLDQISALYEETEQNAQNKLESSVDKNDIKNIFSDIRDAARCLGMDMAAFFSNDPVNLSTGNYVYEKTLLKLNTALDIKFRIFYNVQLAGKGILGKGWIHNYECHLKFQENEIIFIDDDFSEKTFYKSENGTYDTLQKQNGTLKKTEDGYLMQDREGMQWIFDRKGVLLQQRDLMGNTNFLSYDKNRRLLKVSDQYDNGIIFHYNKEGFLTAVEDHTSRKVLLAYDRDLLTKITAPEGREISYHYDSAYRLNEIVNAKGTVILHNEYDMHSRTICQLFSDGGNVRYEYLDQLNQVEMVEQNGNKILYEHDARMRGIKAYYTDSMETSEFNNQDQRTSYTDRRGNTTRYHYNENGTISDIITPLEDHFHLEYTPFNQLKGVSINGEVLYQAFYNDRNQQEFIENACGGKARFEYDRKGQLITCIQEDGSKISLEYDEAGNISAIINPMGGRTSYIYDNLRRVIATIDAKGQKTSYSYNDADELIMVCNAEGSCRTYQYDACGNITCLTDYNGGITKFTYNDLNRMTSVIDPDGSATKYEYDVMWNLVKEIAPDGGITTYEYDQLHRVISITGAEGNTEKADYDACGNLIRRVDASGAEHYIQYDEMNRPIEIKDPNGGVTSAQYDAQGNVTKVTFADGSYETATFDLTGNQLSFTNRAGYCQTYQYDKLGNLTEIADKNGWLEHLEYYPGGLLKKEVRVEGTCWEYRYDANQNIEQLINQDGLYWKFAYDSLDQLIHVENSEGFTEDYEYDLVGNITSVIAADGVRTEYTYSLGGTLTSMVDACGNKTSFFYDSCHRLTEILQMEEGQIDVNQINELNRNQKQYRLTSYRYDQAGHMTQWIDPEGNITSYGYDVCGRLCSRTDPDGNYLVCTYNPDGTEKSYILSDGRSIQMQYNALRQLIELKDWTGITSITPDKMGRPLAIEDSNSNILKYEWGDRGEKMSVSYPNGDMIRYEYDNALRLKRCYLEDGIVNYSYYDNGQLHKKIGPGNLITEYKYNASGRIAGLCHSKEGNILDKFSYHYDKNGRKSSVHCMRSGVEGSGNYEYRYNALGSLVSVFKDGSEEEQYQYDCFGNRTWSKVRGVETRYAYNKLDQLTDLYRNGVEHHYSYEKNGNLACEWRDGSLFRQMRYDTMDRLISVEMSNQKTEYTYNGFGFRVGETTTGAVQRHSEFLYDITKDCQNLMSAWKDGLITNYFWDGSLLGEAGSSGRKYYFCDSQMTPLRASGKDDNGFALSYDSFGCLTGMSGTGRSVLGYTGYYMPQEDGLAYAYQRDYEPKTGRFLSRDPIMGAITTPLALNAYNYCMGDPVNRYDPTGAIAVSGTIAAWLAGGIVGAISNIVAKAAGDVVNSVKNGKITMSSWQSYVGTAAGGFTSGIVLVASKGNAAAAGAAGAAGSAVETLVTNGLSMIFGAEGYTKAEGYTWKSLLTDTVNNSALGAVTGGIFDKASYIKIPGITKGTNSMYAVFITQLKRAAHGYITNVSLKTMCKGVIVFGGVKFFDELISKGIKTIEDVLKSKGGEIIGNLVDHLRNRDGATSVANAKKYLSGNKSSAACPAAGG